MRSPNDNGEQSNRPKFDKRSIYAGLIIWEFALLLLLFIYVFDARHPPIPGEPDLGEGLVVVSTVFAAIIVFTAGALSMLLGLVHFLWLSWRFGHRNTSATETS